jgi:hypothetical protein
MFAQKQEKWLLLQVTYAHANGVFRDNSSLNSDIYFTIPRPLVQLTHAFMPDEYEIVLPRV